MVPKNTDERTNERTNEWMNEVKNRREYSNGHSLTKSQMSLGALTLVECPVWLWLRTIEFVALRSVPFYLLSSWTNLTEKRERERNSFVLGPKIRSVIYGHSEIHSSYSFSSLTWIYAQGKKEAEEEEEEDSDNNIEMNGNFAHSLQCCCCCCYTKICARWTQTLTFILISFICLSLSQSLVLFQGKNPKVDRTK